MSATKQNFRILVVDDDQSTRSLLQSVLSAEGYECLTAHSIATAEAILRKEPAQLALLDLYLGTANGLNVLDLIKVLQPHCACVMMTAHPSVETVTRSIGSGALEYLGKPLLIDGLLAAGLKAACLSPPAPPAAGPHAPRSGTHASS